MTACPLKYSLQLTYVRVVIYCKIFKGGRAELNFVSVNRYKPVFYFGRVHFRFNGRWVVFSILFKF